MMLLYSDAPQGKGGTTTDKGKKQMKREKNANLQPRMDRLTPHWCTLLLSWRQDKRAWVSRSELGKEVEELGHFRGPGINAISRPFGWMTFFYYEREKTAKEWPAKLWYRMIRERRGEASKCRPPFPRLWGTISHRDDPANYAGSHSIPQCNIRGAKWVAETRKYETQILIIMMS